MNNPPLSWEMTINILKNGTFYFPASKHYDNQTVNVVCDRCHKIKLDVCIGYDLYDLCLPCVQEISNQYNFSVINPPPVYQELPVMTMMLQRQFSPKDDIKTYMMQEQFNPRSFGMCTNMLQSSCRKY